MEKKAYTIVVAEDDDDERMILTAASEAIGCRGECRFVNSGQEVLDYLAHKGKYADVSELPDLILLDVKELEGWCETLKNIKSKPAYDRIPVVVLTTSTENGDQRCLDLEADAFVRKPLGFDKYVEALKSALAPFCKEAMD
jgi:CheY-like chemotaxis protein